jgi:uncharacterized protein YjiS (DUF1127 family)
MVSPGNRSDPGSHDQRERAEAQKAGDLSRGKAFGAGGECCIAATSSLVAGLLTQRIFVPLAFAMLRCNNPPGADILSSAPVHHTARIRRVGPIGEGGCAGVAGGTLPARAEHASPAPAFLEIGPMDLLKQSLLVWAQHREFRAVYAELNGYSDRQLAELGLSRSDVARVAYEEAERRIVTPSPEPPGRLLFRGLADRSGLRLWPLETVRAALACPAGGYVGGVHPCRTSSSAWTLRPSRKGPHDHDQSCVLPAAAERLRPGRG